MRYLIRAEIAVSETDGEMEDVMRTTFRASTPSLELAQSIGEELEKAVQGVLARYRKISDVRNQVWDGEITVNDARKAL